MKRKVTWTWGAEADLQEAFSRVEDQRKGSGSQLLGLLDRLLELVRQFPEMAAVWRTPVRRALVRRSNFGLFYVLEPSRIVVIALLDLRRDPAEIDEQIKKRLPQ